MALTALGPNGSAERLDGPTLVATASRAMAGWAMELGELVDLTDPAMMSCLPIRTSAPVGPWLSARITPIGDATHAMTPFRGIGADKAKAFYEQALGWTFEAFAIPDGAYWVAKNGDRFVGGLSDMAIGAIRDAKSPYWFPFIEVDDVDARIAKAKTLGAEVMTAPLDVPNVGRIAVLRDPTGAAIGWMTSLKQPG